MNKPVANEKWILTVKELHLGHCKETFRAGAVIELDENNGRLIIDGRRFNDTRDLDVLKRQAIKFPDRPWVIPYSKESHAAILHTGREAVIANPRPQLRDDQRMQVIQSDQDLNEEIDISHTQVSKINTAAKVASREKVKTEGMEIIRGDETVEDRIAALKGKTDIGSIAERSRLKATGATRMAIVKDDSLGAGFTGKNSVSLNAGQYLPTREEADSKKAEAEAQAAARKKEAAVKRQESESTPDEVVTETEGVESDNEKETLMAENAELKSRLERLEKMMLSAVPEKPRRGRKPGSVNKE